MAKPIKIWTGTEWVEVAVSIPNLSTYVTSSSLSAQLLSYKEEVSLSIDHTYSTTLANGRRYFVDTSGGSVTLTLPAAPAVGNEIQVFDAAGNAATNNITIDRNSVKINGGTDNLLIDLDGGAAALIYTGSTYGWKVA